MATTIINPPSQLYPVLTSSLYSMAASTDKIKVSVEIVRDPDGDDDCFFTTTLYAHNGVVELADIGSLIEERFRAKRRIWNMMEVRFDGVAAEFTALYCECVLDPDFDCTKCFLTAAGSSIVHRNSAISLAHWTTSGNNYLVQVVGTDSNGQTVSVQRNFSKSRLSDHVSFSVDEIIRFALLQPETDQKVDIAKVAYFAISYGSISKIFYLMEHPFFLTFAFRNMFNVYEYLDVVGTLTRKTKYDRESSFCFGQAKQYNQKVERTYEMVTGSLTDEQVRELEQLIGSRDVQLCASGYDHDIIITDHSIEVDNDDESLSSIKFTFRFMSERASLISDELGELMPSANRIFTQEFTAQFV